MGIKLESEEQSFEPKLSAQLMSDLVIHKRQELILKSTEEEMGVVKEENERLKTMLSQMVKDYQALQKHLFDIVGTSRDRQAAATTTAKRPPVSGNTTADEEEDPQEFVTLSLGPTSSSGSTKSTPGTTKVVVTEGVRQHKQMVEDDRAALLSLRLASGSDFKEHPNSNNNNNNNKIRSSDVGIKEEEPAVLVKKARVSVRTRCDSPTVHDGCQWRKYGQKTSKGNPCPKAYYRCTVAPSCPVRRHVQRCAEDMSVLITTYEGVHNHHLPVGAASAMASMTSAAATMMLSGSSPSTSGGLVPAAMKFFNPSSMAASSSTPSYPTITLDLTTEASGPPPPPRTSSGSCLSFSASGTESSSRVPSSSPPPNWTPYGGKNLSFYETHVPKSPVVLPAKASAATAVATPPLFTYSLTETLAKTIASMEPCFQSALASAIAPAAFDDRRL